MKSKFFNLLLALGAAIALVYYFKSRFRGPSAGAVDIIGGADGPTVYFVASKIGSNTNQSMMLIAFVGLLGIGYGIYKLKRKN